MQFLDKITSHITIDEHGEVSLGDISNVPHQGALLRPKEAMSLAVSQALCGAGRVSPNPLVGCVITDKNHRFVSAGYHKVYGSHHAEVNAIQNIPSAFLKGAHVYVTLEPCAHQGKTPSCAKMLAQLPIRAVIYGIEDPFEKVQGQGLKILNDAGIKTHHLTECRELCESLLENFFYNQKHKAPFVAVKMATGMDGKMCLSNGDSQWITNKKSRGLSHWLRAYYDATAIGVGTLKADDPQLDIRLNMQHTKDLKNKIIIFDQNGESFKFLKTSNILKTHDASNIYIVTSNKTDEAATKAVSSLGLNIVSCPDLPNGQLDIAYALKSLYEKGITSIMVEGGPTLIGSFIAQKKAQRVLQFTAAKIMGQGRSYSDELYFESMDKVVSLEGSYRCYSGNDTFVSGLIN